MIFFIILSTKDQNFHAIRILEILESYVTLTLKQYANNFIRVSTICVALFLHTSN